MNNTVLISKNVRLTYKLTAEEIFVSNDGSVTMLIENYGPNISIPDLSLDYLEALCSRFYFGGEGHRAAIADIMLLNGVLVSILQYEDFYFKLGESLRNRRYIIITQ